MMLDSREQFEQKIKTMQPQLETFETREMMKYCLTMHQTNCECMIFQIFQQLKRVNVKLSGNQTVEKQMTCDIKKKKTDFVKTTEGG